MPGGLRRKHVVALAAAALMMVALAACTRLVTHEPGSVGYDAIQTSGSTSFANSQDVKAYDGSWEGKAHLDASATGTSYARGVIHANVANGKSGFYGGAFYLPPGTLDGPSPKQTADVDIMGWNYAAAAEFGGIRIGQDHKARLVRGNAAQVDTIGSSFPLQEGCWNWIAVRQKLSDKPASDPAHALNWVYVNGQKLVDSNAPNNFGHGADDMRFGLVSVNTPAQDQALDVYVDNSFIANNDERFAPPTQSLCNALSGVEPSTIGMSAQTPLADATKFLYTGDFPIQHGVSSGTIEDKRAAVIRGHVIDRSGQALDGARVIVVDHPELGYTTTRPDGRFYLAANGGGELRIRIEKDGYLPVERTLDVPWQDYADLPEDVVLIPYDTQTTDVQLSPSSPSQVARGSPVTDSDGTRHATLFFLQGTTATMKLSGGSSQPLPDMTVHATEYTVDANGGPKAMPAELPPTSAYTYAVNFSANEALQANASEVDFSQPVAAYFENFLGFPVGTPVPLGYYDPGKGAWVPAETGVVVKVLDEQGGVASLDVDGSNSAASQTQLDQYGITNDELGKLAELYSTGQELWRVRINHFSNYDANWGFGLPAGAQGPLGSAGFPSRTDHNCQSAGSSTIECEDQVLGEHEDLTGNGFGLSYTSDRAPGRTANDEIKIPLTDANPPADLKGISIEIDVAGQHFRPPFELPTDPAQRKNLSYTFSWDGKDVFGRKLQGSQPVTVGVGYTYDGSYERTARFGAPGGTTLTGSRTRRQLTLWSYQRGRVGGWDARGDSLGGWSLDVHHVYDPNSQTLYLGDGSRRTAQEVSRVVTRVAGGGTSTADGVAATDADLFGTFGVAAAPDGSYYLSDVHHQVVRRVAPDGTITTVAGMLNQAGSTGDGGPATSAKLNIPLGLDVGPDGSLYIADTLNSRIRRVFPDGHIETVAGGASPENTGDGGPATDAGLQEPYDVAVAPDGSFYISTYRKLRRVDPQGTIGTVYTSPEAQRGIWGVDVAPDGSVYISDGPTVRKLAADGTVTTVAGQHDLFGYSGDNVLGGATQALLRGGGDVLARADGSFYVADAGNHKVRYVSTDGTITTVAGKDLNPGQDQPSPDGTPARKALIAPEGLSMGADGSLLVADIDLNRIDALASPLPGFSGDDIAIPSEDGAELYQFDKDGRHLRTLNSLTGATLYSFAYDPAGRLSSVTDGDGNVTQIERDASGNPTAIVAPFGQRTTLGLDTGGLLNSITNPNNERTQLGYTHSCADAPDGILSSLTDPRNNTSSYCYDGDGLLKKANHRGGGYKTLDRSPDGLETTLATKLGRTTNYKTTRAANGDLTRAFTDPANLRSTLQVGQDGVTTATPPDGTTTTLARGPDPRFGMDASVLQSMTTRTPDGKTLQLNGTRQVSPQNPPDPLSFESQTDTLQVNGRSYTTTYTAANRRFTTTSPQGRTTSTDIDGQGRPTQQQVTDITPLALSYDSNGRLQDQTQGSRNWHYTYKPASQPDSGFLDTTTDPAGRVTSFSYDAAGRVTKEFLPGSREVDYSYDSNGNLASVTPPSRPAHTFSFNAVDLLQDYNPPAPGATSGWDTSYSYNDDHDLTAINRPDGTSVTFHYEPPPARRLDYFDLPNGRTSLSYDPQTGNLASLTAPGNEKIDFVYDGSLPKHETFSGTISASADRTYDNDLRLASSSVNDAQTVNYSYDSDSLLTDAGDLSLTPDPENGLLRATSLSNVTSGLSYNSFGELQSQSASYNQTPLYTENITGHDALGRITDKTETTSQGTRTYHYTYDPQTGFLTDVTKDGVPFSHYAYDANGNRILGAPGAGTSGTGMYDSQDRLTSYGPLTFTYSKAGDLQTKSDARLGATNNTTAYGYDPLGSLQNVTLSDGTRIDYVTDGYGRRIAKKVGGQLVQGFVYGTEALGPVAELDSQGNVKSRFVYASHSNVPDYMVRDGNTYRIITDDLGSPRTIVDASSGQVAEELGYDEFGNVVRDTDPGFQPFGFAGGLYDTDTKLIHFGARDYAPEVGRWTAKDPIAFGGGDSNLYAYVLGDPIDLADPTGLLPGFGGLIKEAASAVPSRWVKPISSASAGLGDALLSVPLTHISAGPLLRHVLCIDESNIDQTSTAYQFSYVVGQIARPIAGQLGRLTRPQVPVPLPERPYHVPDFPLR
jgi:RHS repeat-associated protein